MANEAEFTVAKSAASGSIVRVLPVASIVVVWHVRLLDA